MVNTNGLVLIGIGSEWFWTMVSGIVVAVTFLIIYRQLRAQGAANALQRIDTISGRWSSPEMVLARLEVALALRDGTLDMHDDTRVDTILNFFELVRGLHRQGFIGEEELAIEFGASAVVWWRLLRPVIDVHRADEGDVTLWSGTEQLVAAVKRWDTKLGTDRSVIWSTPVEALTAAVIRRETNRLRLARDAASGVIPDGAERLADVATSAARA
jgi:hypothetical protein